MMSPLPSVGQAFSIISQEESHRSLSAVEIPTSVFYSTQNKTDYKRKDFLKCDHCNWTGHTKDTCYRLHGYPPGHKWYKPQSRFLTKKPIPDFKSKKIAAEANVVEGNNCDLIKIRYRASSDFYSKTVC